MTADSTHSVRQQRWMDDWREKKKAVEKRCMEVRGREMGKARQATSNILRMHLSDGGIEMEK